MILLDTHAAIWFAADDDSLGKHSQTIADQSLADSELAISAITFWEISLLIAKRRFMSSKTPAELRHQLLETGALEIPLTGEIAILAVELNGLPGDPADRFIAATAIVHIATLMTADKALLRWRHKLKRQDASK